MWPVAFAVGTVLAACGSSDGARGTNLTGDAALVVAGASDLRPAFEELAPLFTGETGHEVVFDFGSSGQLAQRIMEGAPVDVFASADVSFVDEVLGSGRGDPASKATYAFGRITIWSSTSGWGGWATLEEVAADDDVEFLAIANPEHAPYGLAAKQALESTGVWSLLQPKLVFGENISDTRRLAANGDADVAVVALSLAIAAGEEGEWVLIDQGLHAPLEQALVVVTDDADRAGPAGAFLEFVSSSAGRNVMESFGFALPGDTVGND
jgi:molybdate transport system substrate-binding protein